MPEYPLYDPANCPCPSKNCARNGKCDECKAYHHANGGQTACERRAGKQTPS